MTEHLRARAADTQRRDTGSRPRARARSARRRRRARRRLMLEPQRWRHPKSRHPCARPAIAPRSAARLSFVAYLACAVHSVPGLARAALVGVPHDASSPSPDSRPVSRAATRRRSRRSHRDNPRDRRQRGGRRHDGGMFSPFLIAPGIASLTVAIMPAVRRTAAPRPSLLVVGMSLAILMPWFAELLGLVSPPSRSTPDSISSRVRWRPTRPRSGSAFLRSADPSAHRRDHAAPRAHRRSRATPAAPTSLAPRAAVPAASFRCDLLRVVTASVPDHELAASDDAFASRRDSGSVNASSGSGRSVHVAKIHARRQVQVLVFEVGIEAAEQHAERRRHG